MNPVFVVGIGNPWRGDDGVGPLVADQLKARIRDDQVRIDTNSGDAFSLMDAWRHYDDVILIDAARSGARPGTVHRIKYGRASQVIRRMPRTDTHGLGIAEAIALSDVLDRTPGNLTIYTVEAASFTPGETLSGSVRVAATNVVEQILADLKRMRTAC